MKGAETPPNFPLQRITAPMSLHHSNVDTLADPRDVKKLASQLNNTKTLHIQTIKEELNHLGVYKINFQCFNTFNARFIQFLLRM